MLCPFQAADLDDGGIHFSVDAAMGATIYAPLTPVCSDHLMQPIAAINKALYV
jgi:hypothetical protein